jgi:hypothetical protein
MMFLPKISADIKEFPESTRDFIQFQRSVNRPNILEMSCHMYIYIMGPFNHVQIEPLKMRNSMDRFRGCHQHWNRIWFFHQIQGFQPSKKSIQPMRGRTVDFSDRGAGKASWDMRQLTAQIPSAVKKTHTRDLWWVAPQKVIFWAWLSHEAVDCFAHSLLFLAEVMNICWLITSYPSLSQIPVFCA